MAVSTNEKNATFMSTGVMWRSRDLDEKALTMEMLTCKLP